MIRVKGATLHSHYLGNSCQTHEKINCNVAAIDESTGDIGSVQTLAQECSFRSNKDTTTKDQEHECLVSRKIHLPEEQMGHKKKQYQIQNRIGKRERYCQAVSCDILIQGRLYNKRPEKEDRCYDYDARIQRHLDSVSPCAKCRWQEKKAYHEEGIEQEIGNISQGCKRIQILNRLNIGPKGISQSEAKLTQGHHKPGEEDLPAHT